MTEQQLRGTLAEELEFWLDAYADMTEAIGTAAVADAVQSWARFDRWYDDVAVAALAAEMAQVSASSQQQTAGAAAQYIAAIAALLGAAAAPAPTLPFGGIRNGAPASLVHTRPAEAYKRAIALGATHEEALAKAGLRAQGVMASDLTLQQRDAEQRALAAAGVTGYRRIIRPELSRTGTCGLCIAASDRIYETGDLMPIHPPSCNCTVMPIIGTQDPGLVFNRQDIGQLYADAGSTRAEELRRTRYAIHQHGEYGPVLTRLGDAFRGPDKVALEDDPARAARLLAKAAPMLRLLESTPPEGIDAAGALAYSRELVDRLEDIVGRAA